MDGKVAFEEQFFTELNNQFWDAKGEEERNGKAFAQDFERRMLDPDLCVAEMDRAGIDVCVMLLTSPGVQSITDKGKAFELARAKNEWAKIEVPDARCNAPEQVEGGDTVLESRRHAGEQYRVGGH